MKVKNFSYDDAFRADKALRAIGKRDLPSHAAHQHVGRCIKAVKPFLEEYQTRNQAIELEHKVTTDVEAEEGEHIQASQVFRDPIGMGHKRAALGRALIHDDIAAAESDPEQAGVTLPSAITDAMLPKKTKANQENDQGLGELLADLGPFYVIPDEA